MTEPGAGSDLRGMTASAVLSGTDWVLNGTKHFISHADIADFSIVFMKSGEEETPRGKRSLITAFFVDKGTTGFSVRDGYRNVSHRGYTNATLEFDNCHIPSENVLGEVHKGFDVANTWLGATRLQVGATCLGRAERAFRHSVEYAAQREQFGRPIGKFQGVSFKLADMATDLEAARALLYLAAAKVTANAPDKTRFSAMAKRPVTSVFRCAIRDPNTCRTLEFAKPSARIAGIRVGSIPPFSASFSISAMATKVVMTMTWLHSFLNKFICINI